MLYLAMKALISGVIIAIVSEVAKRSPGIGSLTLTMFLLLPWLLRNDVSFWAALALSCLVTVTLYAVRVWSLGKIRIDF